MQNINISSKIEFQNKCILHEQETYYMLENMLYGALRKSLSLIEGIKAEWL